MKNLVLNSIVLRIGEFCDSMFPISHYSITVGKHYVDLTLFFEKDDEKKLNKCVDMISYFDVVKDNFGKIIVRHLNGCNTITLTFDKNE